MVKIKTKEHIEGYKDQKTFDKTIPVDGTYDVVNIKAQWQKVGHKGTEKLRLIAHVLNVVEAEDKEGSAKMKGGTFGHDIWWNLTKDGKLNFNGQRLVNQVIAVSGDVEFDPEDKTEVVKLTTGVPYRIKIKVEVDDAGERTFYNVEVQEVKHLAPDARKKYSNDPDWKKIVPPLDERRLEDADYSSKDGGDRKGGKGRKIDKEGETRTEQAADPFTANTEAAGFIDDDLPF